MKNIETLIRSGEATIVDVRTAPEFLEQHIPGSVNIPLKQIPARLAEFRAMKKIVLCCASGGRSSQAADFLKKSGIQCEDAGSWININNYELK